MKLSERKLRAIDKAAARIQESLLESVSNDIYRPWFIVIRIELIKLVQQLGAK